MLARGNLFLLTNQWWFGAGEWGLGDFFIRSSFLVCLNLWET